MNTAILHGARPGDRSTAKTGSMGFKRAAAMANRMGIDLTKLGSQADNVWSMLNDLAENDPKGYEEFLQTQMEEAKKERENSGRRCFTPRAGVVIKMTLTNRRSKGVQVKTLKGPQPGETLYMNMCGFDGCEAPTSGSGQPVVDSIVNRPTADALRIPLVVGKIRSKGEEGTGGVCHFVDVVFHPWVLEQSLQHTFFLAQVVDLAKQWVQEEVGVALDKAWTRLETKTYVGGDGKGGTQPLPFFLDEVVDQENPPEQRKSKDTAAMDGKAPTPVPPKTLSDPTAVLKELRQQEQRGLSQGDLATEHSLLKKPAGRERPLVQELGGAQESESFRQGSQRLTNAAAEAAGVTEAYGQVAERQRTAEPLIKKGFLSSSDKTAELYPEGGSTEGTKPGFLGKCKIVDTTQMSQSEIEEAMQQHAGPTPPQPRTRVAPTVSGKLNAKATMHLKPRAPDEEFERLVEAMDPDFGLHKETPEEDEALLELARLASALGSMPSSATIFHQVPALDNQSALDGRNNGSDSGNRDRPEPSTACTVDGMSQVVFPGCSQALPTVPYVVSLSGDGRSLTVTIDLSVAAPGLRASELELTVGDGVLRLTGPQGIELDMQLDKGVLAGSERASFQRKTRQFIVTFDVK